MNINNPVILTIEDEPVVRRIIRTYLEDQGYSVLEAEDGKSGLEVYNQHHVDLILLDLIMPGMHGLKFLSEFRQIEPELPVIVVSGEGRRENVVEALQLGASDYILKPLNDLLILRHSVERALERTRLIQANRKYQAQLETEVIKKNDELTQVIERLHDVVESTKKLFGCGEINESGPMILEEFGKHLKARGGSLYEVDDDRLIRVHSLDSGHAAGAIDIPPKVGSVMEKAIKAAEPFIVNDMNEEGWLGSGWSGYSSPACIVFPLRDHGGDVFAVLFLHDPENNTFAAYDREIGVILASYVSEALQAAKVVAAVKRNEELIMQSQKLEAMGTLASGIAHDFNNILSAIVGYTDLSLFTPDLPDNLINNLEQVKKAGQRARDLVQQILSFSRMEESQVGPVNISPIVKEALKLLRASLPASIAIEKMVSADLPMIKADPGKIHQILMNLCTNAAHAMKEQKGVLTVAVEPAKPESDNSELTNLAGKNCLRITVSDTGCGISADNLSRIFDPYYTTKQKGEGTGLGLAMVHAIVHSAGGVVTVESELGVGTRFDLYFPGVIESVSKTDHSGDYSMPQGSERILFVDDEVTLAEMAGEMLGKLGYTVTILNSGVDVCTTLEENPDDYDLVITDQTMPGISGFDLAREVLRILPNIPIILYTGYSAKVSEAEAKEIGISRVLMKPLSMTMLAQVVRQVLDGKE